MRYRTPDPGNPRVRRTRDRILAAAGDLLSEAGPAGLTYSQLAERAGVTRQTLYRHWPSRSRLLVDLILEGSGGGLEAGGYPEPGADPGAVVAAWLGSLRAGISDPARRAAGLAVTAQADTDPDSAEALAQLTADRIAALNEVLRPSGIQVEPEEYALLSGPVLARIFFERGEVTDSFIEAVVDRWLAGRPTPADR
ncbi:MAG TPA: TetR/AcrR family transcriptional regulator [Trebonia sp.]|jgi:AcrR family transcriptional regulator